MAIFSVSGAEVRLHTEQPVHFSLGTLPQNPRYSHNPTAVRFLGLSLDRPPRPLPRSHCRPQSLCSVVSSRAPVNQISQIAPPRLPPPSSYPLPSSAHCPSSPATKARTMASQHLWGERWLPWGPSSSKALDHTTQPAQNLLAPPHTHTHLNSRQDRSVNLPRESQVVRKNRDWINRPVSGPTLLTERSGRHMRTKAHAQQRMRTHTLRVLTELGVCGAGCRRRQWHPTLAWKIPWMEEPGGLHSPCGR